MTIEVKEKGTKAFYQEVVNVIGQYKRLLKKPDAKLNDNFKSYIIMMIAMGILFLTQLCRVMFDGFSAMTGAAAAAALIAFVLLVISLMNMNRAVDAYLKDERESVVTLDEKGVELSKGGSQVTRLGWEDVAFVRSFKEGTCFLSKDVTGLVISVINTHKDEIMGYLEDNDIDVKIIK